MATTAHHALSGTRGPEKKAGPLLRLLLRRRGLVLVVALLLMIVAGVVGRDAGDKLTSGAYLDPSAESQRAAEALTQDFPGGPANLVLIAEAVTGTVDSPQAVERGRELTAQLSETPGVGGLQSYWETPDPSLRADDRRSALIAVQLTGGEHAAQEAATRIIDDIEQDSGALEVGATGPAAVGLAVDEQAESDLISAEMVTLPITLLVLLLVFGSAIAAGLPLLVGAGAVVGTLAMLGLLAELTTMSTYALNLTTALGFGLAVDYSLFLVTRFREERRAGRSVEDAVVIAVRTAGRTVVFSAVTVALSLSALLLFPMPFLRSLGFAGIAVTALAALTAVVLVPAMLAQVGHRLDRADLFAPIRRRITRRRARLGDDRLMWHRIAALVMRRPVPVLVSVSAVLILLVLPFAGVRFGLLDHRTLPADNPVADTAERLAWDFPAAADDPITVVLPGRDATPVAELDEYAARLSTLPGVTSVDSVAGRHVDGQTTETTGEQANDAGDTSAAGTWLAVTPSAADPADARSVVRDIREQPAPGPVLVGGSAATLVDATDTIADRLPWALGVIALSTFVLLFLFTGSLLIPVKAIVTNLLSLSATFGALVYVFQEGHLRWLVGDFTPTGTLETTLPVLVFCIAFGLSMDYEVFLLSRITEAHLTGATTAEAVAQGLQRTGGLITAAAAILVTVFLALAASNLTALKVIGVGLTLAVVLDATIVRGLLVPAIMRLAGEANWWAPAPLRRLHKRLGLTD
ncbi:MMPL family transporter [Pimelobacter simplex]|uniref:MMPL family transporter n=1 Tax=Nocardioides simplex TaxID=2045 RepID=UPI002150285F|nr:MMPL family transporter [Pimelobacter simplex]UUW88612.1 MMPL family transporter [Pimelobacter simplex]UUW98117.1 MMPL family transporter [Pimelobacter simplex]